MRLFHSQLARDSCTPTLNSPYFGTPDPRYLHTFQDRYFEFSRVDALAMERLSSNPYIMDIYGFCGVSVMTDRGETDVAHVVDHLDSRDKLTVAQKIAESIASVHEIDGKEKPASLVHNDINVGNIFWSRGEPKLNDFNVSVVVSLSLIQIMCHISVLNTLLPFCRLPFS